MKIEFYQADAFCHDLFSGNPAGVCPMDQWPDKALIQNIAMENNLAADGFLYKEKDHYHILRSGD